VGSDAIATRKGLIKKVVGTGTQISIQLQSHQPSACRYTIERVVPDPPVVRDEEGQVLDLEPADVALICPPSLVQT
jgi:hypothetical protein